MMDNNNTFLKSALKFVKEISLAPVTSSKRCDSTIMDCAIDNEKIKTAIFCSKLVLNGYRDQAIVMNSISKANETADEILKRKQKLDNLQPSKPIDNLRFLKEDDFKNHNSGDMVNINKEINNLFKLNYSIKYFETEQRKKRCDYIKSYIKQALTNDIEKQNSVLSQVVSLMSENMANFLLYKCKLLSQKLIVYQKIKELIVLGKLTEQAKEEYKIIFQDKLGADEKIHDSNLISAYNKVRNNELTEKNVYENFIHLFCYEGRKAKNNFKTINIDENNETNEITDEKQEDQEIKSYYGEFKNQLNLSLERKSDLPNGISFQLIKELRKTNGTNKDRELISIDDIICFNHEKILEKLFPNELISVMKNAMQMDENKVNIMLKNCQVNNINIISSAGNIINNINEIARQEEMQIPSNVAYGGNSR